MAVVTENGAFVMGRILGEPMTDGRADHKLAGGRVHSWLEQITIAVTDEATSTYQVARLPKEAVLLPASSYETSAAITGDIDFGDSSNPDGLIDAGDPSADAQTFLNDWTAFVDGAAMGQPLWKVLGYASASAAPAQIDLYVTLNTSTQATNPAIVTFNLLYTVD